MAFVPLDLEAMAAFCDRSAILYERLEGGEELVIRQPDMEGWAIRVLHYAGRDLTTVAYPVPVRVPPDRRAEISRLVNLLNLRTYMGAWVHEPDLGELAFRVTVLTEGVLHDDDGIRAVLETVVGTVENALSVVQRVFEGEPADIVDDPDT